MYNHLDGDFQRLFGDVLAGVRKGVIPSFDQDLLFEIFFICKYTLGVIKCVSIQADANP